PAAEPATEPVTEPVTESVAESVAEPVAEPAAEPTIAPATEKQSEAHEVEETTSKAKPEAVKEHSNETAVEPGVNGVVSNSGELDQPPIGGKEAAKVESEPVASKEPKAEEPAPTSNGDSSVEKDVDSSSQPAPPVQDAIPEPTVESTKDTEEKDSIVPPELVGAGAAAAIAAGAVVAGVVSKSHKEPEVVATLKDDVNIKEQSRPNDDKQEISRLIPAPQIAESSISEMPTPEPESDPALVALAGDREALLRKLELPSTEQLPAEPTSSTKDNQAVKPAGHDEHVPSSTHGPSVAGESPAPTESDVGKAVAPKNNEESRSPSQNRSVTAVSLNHKRDSWLRTILRAVFGNFFGAIFSPFRRRGRTNQ
ncbi:hypothetical protein KXX57_006776, partial [Aspergillus fumigatus]